MIIYGLLKLLHLFIKVNILTLEEKIAILERSQAGRKLQGK